jgi:hypothetical protein
MPRDVRTRTILNRSVAFEHCNEGAEQWIFDDPEINTCFVIQRVNGGWDNRVHTEHGEWRTDLDANDPKTLDEALDEMTVRILIEWLGCDKVTHEQVNQHYAENADEETLLEDLACVYLNGTGHNPGSLQALAERGLIERDGQGWFRLTAKGHAKLGGDDASAN